MVIRGLDFAIIMLSCKQDGIKMHLTFPASLSTILAQAVVGEEGSWEISHQQEATSVGMGLLQLEEDAKDKKDVCL